MGSWFVLSALGLYALAPGSSDYVLGSPLFAHVRLRLPGGRSLNVVAENASPRHVYVASASLNDVPLRKVVPYEQLIKGGTLRFVMTDTPNVTRPAGPTSA